MNVTTKVNTSMGERLSEVMASSAPSVRYDFTGRVVLITGGGSGIGRGMAEAFFESGATVVVTGRRAAPLEEFCQRHPGRSSFVQMDVGVEDSRQSTIDTVIECHGRLDVLVNNALAVYDKPFSELTLKQTEIMYRILLLAPTRMTQMALPHLLKTGGNVINTSSVGATYISYPTGGLAVYSAAKAGLNQLTRALAAELGNKHIRVNAVAPGATRVGTQASDQDGVTRTVANTPMGRMGEPQDIARVALFLASPAAAWVTGQVIEASGGWGLSG